MALVDRAIKKFPDSGTFLTFLEDNLLPNEPCVFGESFTKDWRARQEWKKVDEDIPNLDYLEKKFGDALVPVADCSRVEFSTHPKTEMSFKKYVQYWRSKVIGDTSATDLLYLKDWHFVKDFPDYNAYTVPDFFLSDWMNEAWSARQDVSDDYRFVYMGPKGTWTPFHADVFRSYSWSANVCGCKEWLFYPPGEEDHLRDKFGRLPFDVTSTEMENRELYPHFHKSSGPIRVLQNSGEIIFVPSGWHHQVRNVEHTISINHNWTNASGIVYTWRHLQSELMLVKKELDDCKTMEEWDEQCQVVLKSTAGINYWEFVQLLCTIAKARLIHLKQTLPVSSNLHGYFDSLSTLIQKALSNPSRPVTFFKCASDFDSVKTSDNMELVLKKCVFPVKRGETTDRLLAKLVGLLPSCLQKLLDTDVVDVDRQQYALVLFRLYELHVIDGLLSNVLAVVLQEYFSV